LQTKLFTALIYQVAACIKVAAVSFAFDLTAEAVYLCGRSVQHSRIPMRTANNLIYDEDPFVFADP
jgi:hypothetical protein